MTHSFSYLAFKNLTGWGAGAGSACAIFTDENWGETIIRDCVFDHIDYAKAFECVDHNKLWKILKEIGIPDHLTCLMRNLYAAQEATVRTGHGTQTGSKLGKEYVKAVYCHPAYLTSMQSTS